MTEKMTEKEAQDILLGLSHRERIARFLAGLATFVMNAEQAGYAIGTVVESHGAGERTFTITIASPRSRYQLD